MKKFFSSLNLRKIVQYGLIILFTTGLIIALLDERYDIAADHIVMIILTSVLIVNRLTIENHAKLITSYGALVDSYEGTKKLRNLVTNQLKLSIDRSQAEFDLLDAEFKAYKEMYPATPKKNVRKNKSTPNTK